MQHDCVPGRNSSNVIKEYAKVTHHPKDEWPPHVIDDSLNTKRYLETTFVLMHHV